jgi:hypothetical protein
MIILDGAIRSAARRDLIPSETAFHDYLWQK